MILLDAINGMNDVTFTLKDVIYISGFIIGGTAAWFKIKHDKQTMEITLDNLDEKRKEAEIKYKEEVISSTNGRRGLRKEFKEELEKQIQVTHARIDRVRDDNIKSYEKLEQRIIELETKGEINTGKILDAITKARK